MKVNLTDVLGSEGLDVASGNLTPCKPTTPHDLNTTRTASEVIIALEAGIFYLALCMLSVLGLWSTSCARLCSSRGTFFVFFIGALLASVNVFSNSDNLEVKLYFRLSAFMLVGIGYTFLGAYLFFSLPDEGENRQTLGQQQPSMGCVVGVVTFLMFLLEAVLLAFACTKGAKNAIWILIIIDKSAFFLQKPIQLAIYLYLRTTCLSRQEFKGNAEFYFRIMSFFNFIEWIDAQVNVEIDVALSLSGPITDELDGWFNVFAVGYKALIIDYRLLCCFLFLEHSAEIPDVNQLPGVPENEDFVNCMTSRDHLKMYAGFFAGCLCITAPVLCGLYFIHSLKIDAFVQVFAIIVNTAIFVLAAFFLCSNDLEEGEISESMGVKIMVSSSIFLGFVCKTFSSGFDLIALCGIF